MAVKWWLVELVDDLESWKEKKVSIRVAKHRRAKSMQDASTLLQLANYHIRPLKKSTPIIYLKFVLGDLIYLAVCK